MITRRYAKGRIPLRRLVAVSVLAAVLASGICCARTRQADAQGIGVWTPPSQIARELVDAAEPSIAFTPDGTAHALWQANGLLYYAYQAPQQPWTAPKRIASGSSPGLALDNKGQLHGVFANSFQGNYEIYHITLRADKRWSLPIPVSRTSGPSVQPVLVADKAGTLHAAWMDYMSEEWLIYIGAWNGQSWSSYAVNNATGKDPTLAVLSDGAVALAWQYALKGLDGLAGSYDIFVSERENSTWSLPIDLSIRPDGAPVDSTGVAALAGLDGKLLHLTWQEGDRDIVYAFGRRSYWPSPVGVGHGEVVARGPQIAFGAYGLLYIAWDEGEDIWVTAGAAGATNWPPATHLAAPLGDQKDVSLASMKEGLSLGWVQTDGAGVSAVYERRLLPIDSANLPYRAYLPLTLR